jgi:hypothetical protein
MAKDTDKAADKAADTQAERQAQADKAALAEQQRVDKAIADAGKDRLPSLGGPNIPDEG